MSVVLERLRPDHAPALLVFERENRAFFAATVADRGDAYFAEFDARHQALLDEQEGGTVHFHVLVAEDGAILGRINLVDVADGAAELGYRIAEKAGGKGLATAAVRAVVQLAASEYRLTRLWAGASDRNPASQAVLTRAGFRPFGKSNTDLGPGTRYELMLEEA